MSNTSKLLSGETDCLIPAHRYARNCENTMLSLLRMRVAWTWTLAPLIGPQEGREQWRRKQRKEWCTYGSVKPAQKQIAQNKFKLSGVCFQIQKNVF